MVAFLVFTNIALRAQEIHVVNHNKEPGFFAFFLT